MTTTVSQRTPDLDPEAELGHEYDGPCVGRPAPVTADGCLVVLPEAELEPEAEP